MTYLTRFCIHFCIFCALLLVRIETKAVVLSTLSTLLASEDTTLIGLVNLNETEGTSTDFNFTATATEIATDDLIMSLMMTNPSEIGNLTATASLLEEIIGSSSLIDSNQELENLEKLFKSLEINASGDGDNGTTELINLEGMMMLVKTEELGSGSGSSLELERLNDTTEIENILKEDASERGNGSIKGIRSAINNLLNLSEIFGGNETRNGTMEEMWTTDSTGESIQMLE